MKLSTTWHPKIDSQTKHINGVIEQYFRVYINYLQDNWPDQLLLAKFVNNNTKSKTTKVTLFFANKNFQPWINFESAELSPSNTNKINTNIFTTCIEKIQKILQNNMFLTQTN